MKNYQQSIRKSTIFRDYEKVKSVIEHPENKEIHMDSIYQTVWLFLKTHGRSEYYDSLYESVRSLNEKFFDERIEKLKNAIWE